jgi:hypothetical protein
MAYSHGADYGIDLNEFPAQQCRVILGQRHGDLLERSPRCTDSRCWRWSG